MGRRIVHPLLDTYETEDRMFILDPYRGLSPDAKDFFDRVTAAGGTLSESTKSAVNAFVRACYVGGFWSKVNRMNLFCGNQLAAALVPLKVGGGNATDTATNFVSGDYSEATGLTGNTGVGKYLNTGLNPSASLTQFNTHLAVYNRSSSPGAGTPNDGVFDGTNWFAHFPPNGDGVFYADHYNQGDGRVNAAVSGPYGLLMSSRTANNRIAAYQNTTQLAVATSTTTSGLANGSVFVFARNNLATATDNHHSYTYGAYSIGAGLSDAECVLYAQAMEAFQDALGRGVA